VGRRRTYGESRDTKHKSFGQTSHGLFAPAVSNSIRAARNTVRQISLKRMFLAEDLLEASDDENRSSKDQSTLALAQAFQNKPYPETHHRNANGTLGPTGDVCRFSLWELGALLGPPPDHVGDGGGAGRDKRQLGKEGAGRATMAAAAAERERLAALRLVLFCAIQVSSCSTSWDYLVQQMPELLPDRTGPAGWTDKGSRIVRKISNLSLRATSSRHQILTRPLDESIGSSWRGTVPPLAAAVTRQRSDTPMLSDELQFFASPLPEAWERRGVNAATDPLLRGAEGGREPDELSEVDEGGQDCRQRARPPSVPGGKRPSYRVSMMGSTTTDDENNRLPYEQEETTNNLASSYNNDAAALVKKEEENNNQEPPPSKSQSTKKEDCVLM